VTEPALADVPRPIGSRWKRVTAVPDHVRAAGAGFLPRAEGTNRPTTGVFRGVLIESGGGDKAAAARDLHHDPLRGPPVTFYQHAESKAAAWMRTTWRRTNKPPNAEIIVDNTVCGSNQRDQDHAWACERILPSILPPNSRLTVWVTRDGGRTWWRGVYRGTGERIKQ